MSRAIQEMIDFYREVDAYRRAVQNARANGNTPPPPYLRTKGGRRIYH